MLVLCLAHQGLFAKAIRREEEDQDVDVGDEAVVPALSADTKYTPVSGDAVSQFSEKLPKHLTEHYKKKGLDGVVYFSFCIA